MLRFYSNYFYPNCNSVDTFAHSWEKTLLDMSSSQAHHSDSAKDQSQKMLWLFSGTRMEDIAFLDFFSQVLGQLHPLLSHSVLCLFVPLY